MMFDMRNATSRMTPEPEAEAPPPAPVDPSARRGRGGSDRALPYFLVLPALLLVALVTGYGIYYAIDYSFYDATLARQNEFIGLSNYRRIFSDPVIRGNILTTFWYMAGAVPVTVALGLGFAVLINRQNRWIGAVRTVLILPWVTSLLITALLWRFLLNRNLGPVTPLLESVGLPGMEFLSQDWAMISMVVASAWNGYAFSMVLLLAALQQVPDNLKRASMVDGASKSLTFWRVTFPYVRPTLLVAIIVGSMHYLNLITIPLVMTGGGPGRSTEILPLRLYTEAFSYYDTGLASAMAVVVLVLNLSLTAIYLWALRDRRRGAS